jgi:glutathione S-transferase
MRTLYELCGAETDRLFSAYAWRVRLTMGYKGLDFTSRPTPFTEIPNILDGNHSKVPVLIDDEKVLSESFDICTYLEESYPQTPRIFGGAGGRENAALIDNLIITGLYPTITRLIVRDIAEKLSPVDHEYFRTSREQRLGGTLEDIQRGRDKERERLAVFLKPYRRRLDVAPFLGGQSLLFSDIALAASFCWAKATSSYDTFNGDPVFGAWFEKVLETCNQSAALKLAL